MNRQDLLKNEGYWCAFIEAVKQNRNSIEDAAKEIVTKIKEIESATTSTTRPSEAQIKTEAERYYTTSMRQRRAFERGCKWAMSNGDSEGEEKIEVYSRDECVFEYCSAPEICRNKEKCQHR